MTRGTPAAIASSVTTYFGKSGYPGVMGVTMGIKELRDSLSRQLAKVKAGETIIVTDHGKPIAKIVPVGEMSVYERLVAEGAITPAKRPKRPVSEHGPPLPPLKGDKTLTDILMEMRGR